MAQKIAWRWSGVLVAVLLVGGVAGIASCGGGGTSPTAPSPTSSPIAGDTRILKLSGNLAFGNVAVGSSNVSTITLTNSGNSTACWSSISAPSGVTVRAISGGGYGDQCVVPDQPETMVVTYAPTGVGPSSGTVDFSAESDGPFASGSVTTLPFSGTGIAAGTSTTPAPTPAGTRIIRVDSNLEFPPAWIGGGSSDVIRRLTISNDGDSVLTVTDVTIEGTRDIFTSDYNHDTYHQIAPNSSWTTAFRFTPKAAISYSQTVTITSDATSGTKTSSSLITVRGASNDVRASHSNFINGLVISQSRITGSGTIVPPKEERVLYLLSKNLEFGNVMRGGKQGKELVAENYGNAEACWDTNWVSYISGGAVQSEVTIEDRNSKHCVQPGGKYFLTVWFRPSATAKPGTAGFSVDGPMQGTIIFKNNGTNFSSGSNTWNHNAERQVTVTFSGTSIAIPPPTPAPTPPPPPTVVSTRIIGVPRTTNVEPLSISPAVCVPVMPVCGVRVGESHSVVIDITNTGNSTLTVSGVSFSSPGGILFTASPTSGTVAPGGSLPMILTFRPTTQGIGSSIPSGGDVTVFTIMTIASDATSGNGSALLSGVAIAGPTPTPTRIAGLAGQGDIRSRAPDGGVRVGESQSEVFTITNTGNSTLTVSGISFSSTYPNGNTVFTASPTSGTVAPGGSLAVTVTFRPVTAINIWTTMTVASDATSGNGSVLLSGIGIPAPAPAGTRIISMPQTVEFGAVQVGDNATFPFSRPLIITNNGDSVLTVTGVTIEGAAGIFTSDYNPGRTYDIAPGSSWTSAIGFTPRAATSYSQTVRVTSNSTSGTNTSTLVGTGSAAPVAVTRIFGLSGNLAFGNVEVGSSKTLNITITNSGNSQACWSSISAPSGVTFQTTSGEGYGDGCVLSGIPVTMVVKYAPTVAGASSGTVAFSAGSEPFTSGSVTTLPFSGTGTTPAPAGTRIIGFPTGNDIRSSAPGGGVRVGESYSVVMTITNTGNSTLTVSRISFSSTYPNGATVFTASPTSGTVAPGGSLAVTVTFRPVTAINIWTTMTVASDATSGNGSALLSVIGIP